MSPLAISPVTKLAEIDEQLIKLLSIEDMDSDEITRLVIEREVCVQDIKKTKIIPEEKLWRLAIKRTEYIYYLLGQHRDAASMQMHTYAKGRRNVQLYKKFE